MVEGLDLKLDRPGSKSQPFTSFVTVREQYPHLWSVISDISRAKYLWGLNETGCEAPELGPRAIVWAPK